LTESGGLRFEVFQDTVGHLEELKWQWKLVGAEGVVCYSGETFDKESDARSHISKNRGRLKAASFSKVVTLDADS
jgi:hypothetical protein